LLWILCKALDIEVALENEAVAKLKNNYIATLLLSQNLLVLCYDDFTTLS